MTRSIAAWQARRIQTETFVQAFSLVANTGPGDTNADTKFQFTPQFTSSYNYSYSVDSFNFGTSGVFLRIGTTSGGNDGANDVFDDATNRMQPGDMSRSGSVNLIAGVTYFFIAAAGGSTSANGFSFEIGN